MVFFMAIYGLFVFFRRMDTKAPSLVEAGDIAPQVANTILAVACCVGKGAPDFQINEVIKQIHLRVLMFYGIVCNVRY